MFRLTLALVALASPCSATTISSFFTFDYNMPDMDYVEGSYSSPGDAFPGFGMTLFIQFETPVSVLPDGVYTHQMPGVYLELADGFDWDSHSFAVEVAGQFIASWRMDLAYADSTGTSFGSTNGLDHVSIEPDTLFISQAPGSWSSLAARQECYDLQFNRPCSFAPPVPPAPEVPLPAPALLLTGALALLIQRRS